MRKRLGFLFPYLCLSGILAVVLISNLPNSESSKESPSTAMPVCMPCGMQVDADQALSARLGQRTYYFCGPGCRDRLSREMDLAIPQDPEPAADHLDVVCRMEVNRSWGISSAHDGKKYYFCTRLCKDLFDADPASFLTLKCVVCSTRISDRRSFTATYLGKQYELCSEEHRRQFKADPAAFFMHTMWGLPSWLYYASIALVLIISFGLFDWLSRRSSSACKPHPSVAQNCEPRDQTSTSRVGRMVPAGSSLSLPVLSAPMVSGSGVSISGLRRDRFDLLSFDWIRSVACARVARFGLQALVVVLFALVVAAGLFGNPNPAMNIAPLLTWTVWWGLLPVVILFAGKAWCYVCPWDAVAGWTEKLRLWKKSDEGLSLNLRWPRVVRNISIATILFIGLTWFELGFGVTMKPQVTAYLAIAMLLMAVSAALLFEKKSFCRYGCLVGRVSGLYALFAGAEVRTRSAAVCTSCRTKECVKGSDRAYGCPTFLYPGKLQTNTYCIQCMECVQACPHGNLSLNLRPWGSDLAAEGKPRNDEAYLALLMLSITGFHGLTMTPAWQELIDWIRQSAGFGRVLGFSIGMALIMVAPIAVYALLVSISHQLAQRRTIKPLTYRDYFIRYAYALLPIALFYHIAHNLEHLLMEGPKVLAMISDPFGWNWNLFGTAHWNIPPFISLSHLWLLQVVLVLIGHVYSLWVAQKTSLRLFGDRRTALKSQIPMLIGMICFSIFSLWLLKQPMEMRTSAM